MFAVPAIYNVLGVFLDDRGTVDRYVSQLNWPKVKLNINHSLPWNRAYINSDYTNSSGSSTNTTHNTSHSGNTSISSSNMYLCLFMIVCTCCSFITSDCFLPLSIFH